MKIAEDMESSRGKLILVSCEAGKPFGNGILDELVKIVRKEENRIETDEELRESLTDSKIKEVHFANGEIKTVFGKSIRGSDLYIVQDVQNSVLPHSINDNYEALKTAIDAARYCGAERITAVIPYYPYSRQDKRKEKEGLSAARVARELEGCGATGVITMDLHNPAIICAFSSANPEILRSSKNIIDYIKSRQI